MILLTWRCYFALFWWIIFIFFFYIEGGGRLMQQRTASQQHTVGAAVTRDTWAVGTTTIGLRFDARSTRIRRAFTARQRSLSSQWRRRLGYCGSDISTVAELLDEADETSFHRILANNNHVLQSYLLDRSHSQYNSRTGAHCKELIIKTSHLNDRLFLYVCCIF